MENKHIVAALGIGLAILLVVLFLFHSNKTLNLDQVNQPDLGLNQKATTATPTPIIVTQLMIQDLSVGTSSAAVAAGDSVTVNYIGALTDGRVFDNTYARRQPFTFQVGAGKIIPGFEQGVIGMKLGGKRKILIPPNLGYGDKAQGVIPANSALIFQAELIDIQEPVTPTPTPSPEVSTTQTPTPGQ